MRTHALEYLACPYCGGKLMADAELGAADGHIMTGVLISACGARFPIRNGVPRLTRPYLTAAAHADGEARDPASSRLLLEASTQALPQIRLDEVRPEERQFLDTIAPLVRGDFDGHTVLALGCDHHAVARMAAYGAQDVIAVSSPSYAGHRVDQAFAATRHAINMHIVEGDMARPPVGRVFDLGICMGALSHLPNPDYAFRSLYGRIVVNGRIAVWVHSYEARTWLARHLAPVSRAVVTHLPGSVLSWASWGPAALLSAAARACRHTAVAQRLPHGAYLHSLSALPPQDVHRLLMEQIRLPPAHYLRREQLERWLRTPDLIKAEITGHPYHEWCATAVVRGHVHSPARAAHRQLRSTLGTAVRWQPS